MFTYALWFPVALARSDISALCGAGINNVLRFDFLSPPPAQNMIRGLEILFALGALDENCQLTQPLG